MAPITEVGGHGVGCGEDGLIFSLQCPITENAINFTDSNDNGEKGS